VHSSITTFKIVMTITGHRDDNTGLFMQVLKNTVRAPSHELGLDK